MFQSELIVSSLGSGISLDLYDELPLSLNFNIADIREPDKRNGDYSKTIKLKGTKKNNQFFEQTYDVSIITNTWNPNIKTPAYFLQQGEIPMKGDMRLMSIDFIKKNGYEDITYNVVLLGRNSNIFFAVGESKLEDLDFSEYNHLFTYLKQNAAESNICDVSGTPTVCANGVGYRYPVIDYGYNNFASNYYHVNWLRPAFFEIEYWRKIFASVGKTFTSVFLDDVTDLACRTIIPNNGEKLTVSAVTQALQEFYAGMTATSSAQNLPLYYTNTNNWSSIHTIPTTFLWNDIYESKIFVKFDDDITNPFVDTGNIYDPVTGIWTVANGANYSILGAVNFDIKLNLPAGATTSTNSNVAYAVKLARSTDGGVTWFMDYYDFFNNSTVLTTSYQTINHNLAIPNKVYNAGDKLQLQIHPLVSWSGAGVNFLNVSVPVTVGTASYDWKLKSNSVVNFKLVTSEIQEGSTLFANDAIPKDIKQRDFLLSVIKKYNLYVDVDPNNPDNYIIEPRDDFYALGSTLDWTSKWAVDKETKSTPMGEANYKTYTWKYKDDQDYYNKIYQDSWQESYGTKTKIITNDFLKSENKTEIIFSASPIVDNPFNDMIIPKIFSYDGTVVKPMKHNIRCVLWIGSAPLTNTWTYGSVSGNVTKSSYAACAMIDNPLSPLQSIEFGVPNEVFYTGILSLYTLNNLYERFYRKQNEEITDKDSKILLMYMKLDASDIARFDFKNRIFIDGSFYLVNKIMDYNSLKEDLCKVEFLKLKPGTSYEPSLPETISSIPTNRLSTGITQRAYGITPTSASASRIGDANNLMSGDNISSKTLGALATGKDISIGEGCYMITVLSSERTSVANNVSACTVRNGSVINIGASANLIDLSNCSELTIDDLVYNYTGFGVHGKTITIADNNKIEYGVTCNFLDGSSH